MQSISINAPEFDLEKTLNSGQVFHWKRVGNGYCGTIGDLPVYVEQRGYTLWAEMASASLGAVGSAEPEASRCREKHAQDAHATIQNYFALDHPLGEICRSFPDEPVMNAARDYCRGLRIIRQPAWECLATFICSSMKRVAHIRQMSHALRLRFGRPAGEIDKCFIYTFPSAQRLAESSEKELRQCALGYRAKNLLATARLVAAEDADLEKWSTFSDVDLQAHLCELPGVGSKVANCVMLFAYERLQAFPIDVWIERVLRKQYGKRKLSVAGLHAFAQNHFGEHGGYAQQYLFHHARTASREKHTGLNNGEVGRRLRPGQFVRGGAVG